MFQRDSLSPLLFCIAITALIHELHRTDCGYQVHGTEREMCQLLCMNGVKLLVRDEDGLEGEMKIVKAFGKDINRNFVLKNWQRLITM